MKTLHSLIRLIGNHKRLFAAALGALLLGVLFEAAGRLVIRDIVDSALKENVSFADINRQILIFIACTVFLGFFHFLSGRWKTATTEKITREIREKLYNHIQRLTFHYHDHTPVGELVQRATSDVDTIRRFYGEQIPGFLQIVFRCIIFFIALALLDIRLALISSVVVPVLTLVSTFFFSRIHTAYEIHQNCEGDVSNAVQENIHGIRVVRAFAQQDRENDMFEIKNLKQREAGMNVVFWHSAYWPVAHILCGIQLTVSILYSGMLVINGVHTIGTMVAATFLFNGLIWPLQDMGRLITEISHSYVSFNRVDEVMKQAPEELKSNVPVPEEPIKGKVEFRNLSFSYTDDESVLKDISFICNPGETIALVGETGSGKTSIVNLLPRFYPYQSGELLIDDRVVTDYSRAFLRKNIGIVEQDPFLFTMTVRENIEYGTDREVSLDEVIEVARAAAVHDSIMDFPEKYDTIVGEKGVSLSGGQKQRIAIARILLKNPHILILDDSTSAVDAGTEQSIREALKKQLKDRTTFVIAHRIQTLQEADQILVLKEGEIVQKGTHEELIANDGFYSTVFKLQTELESQLANEINSEYF
ncbi:MAG: ABC transporter ATP-binding protein [Spirochaetes bacterium]|jgi:ATP-binding cassette subfamily B protein|nr:ABC transporter ATP-binding protein [Spirochaetota bacterium]